MYILSISPKAFVIVKGNELVITADYLKATQYEKVGDTMKAAASANSSLGTHLVRFKRLY
jgi:hypothetical protein